jgi:uncharacterized membrane protein YphA (DoxX/SURF4 family)
MNIAIWALQILAGLAFLAAGIMKSTQPITSLAKQMTWVTVVPPWMVRFIGVAELLGGIGLILPAATGVWPWLTPVAAVALAVVMLLAAGFHVRRSDTFDKTSASLVLLVLTVIIALGRFVVSPL